MDRLSVINVKEELLQREMYIFSLKDFVRIFHVNPRSAKSFLSYHTGSTNSVFTRIKLGVYMLTSNPPSKFELANYLLKPSYVSFESALSFYGILPETVYSVISATTLSPKNYIIDNFEYQYHQIKKELYFGFEPIKLRGRVIIMADAEKALLDYLYLLSLNNKSANDRLNLSRVDKKKFGMYVNYFKKRNRKVKGLLNLVKEIKL